MTALDRYITLNYTLLVNITKGLLVNLKAKGCPTTIVNDAYLYAVEKGIQNDIQKQLIAYIRNTIQWSKLEEYKNKKPKELLLDNKEFVKLTETDLIDFDNLLEHEEAISHKIASIFIFYDNTDALNKIVLKEILSNPTITVREFAKKYDLNVSSAHQILTDIKNKIKNDSKI
jgi:hypothetical protein